MSRLARIIVRSVIGTVILALFLALFAPRLLTQAKHFYGATTSDASSVAAQAKKNLPTAFKATTATTTATTSNAPGVPAGAAAIRSAHTPKTLADDITLRPGQCHMITVDAAKGEYLSDPACTPGAIDPAVTQANVDSTICKSGYTSTVRPSPSLTGAFKKKSLAAYGISYDNTIELDHLISLELGGSSSATNLWPEMNSAGAKTVNNPKDQVENKLAAAVCSRKVTLAAAQDAIATDWITAEAKLGL